jgi:hypothetical protein
MNAAGYQQSSVQQELQTEKALEIANLHASI